MKRIAVLTNDLQHDLVNKNPERIESVKQAAESFTHFLNEMRKRNAVIVHLQLINQVDDPNAERYNGHLPVAKGSHGAKILPEFLGDGDIVMEKNKDSGFYETDLHERLQALDVDTVVVTGMHTAPGPNSAVSWLSSSSMCWVTCISEKWKTAPLCNYRQAISP